ncbi:MAG: YceI family protein, partial [Bizionia sp.]|nr:YceI family protein [Bizionia sp.]
MTHLFKTGVVAVLVAFLSFSFTSNTDKKVVKTDESQVVWKGYKVTGSHEGTIAIASGELHF